MARRERVEKTLQREISSIIHDELKDPRLGFVTITRVEMTPDLRYAKVFFSVLGKDEDYKKTQAALDSGLGFIRSLVAQRVQLRLAPELSFREDRAAEYSIEIENILNQIKQEDASREAAKKIARKKAKKKIKKTTPAKKVKKGKNEPKKSNRKRKKK